MESQDVRARAGEGLFALVRGLRSFLALLHSCGVCHEKVPVMRLWLQEAASSLCAAEEAEALPFCAHRDRSILSLWIGSSLSPSESGFRAESRIPSVAICLPLVPTCQPSSSPSFPLSYFSASLVAIWGSTAQLRVALLGRAPSRVTITGAVQCPPTSTSFKPEPT